MKNVFRGAALVLAVVPSVAGAASDPGSGLPIYPGATKNAKQVGPVQTCGHTMTGTAYIAHDVPLATVVAWYVRAMAGATAHSESQGDPPVVNHLTTLIARDGRTGVSMVQTTFSGAGASAFAEDSRDVVVGLDRYDPPVSPDIFKAHHCR